MSAAAKKWAAKMAAKKVAPKKPALSRAEVAKLQAMRDEIRASLDALESRDERAKLLASRPDLMKDAKMKAWLSKAPISDLRKAIATIPVDDGEAQRQTAEIYARMGRAPKGPAIRREGSAVVFGTLTPEAAREHVKKKNAAR